MDLLSNALLERPQAAEQNDIEDGRAQNARPVRTATRGLRLKRYDAARDYPLIVSWWKARGDECLPADVLPLTGSLAVNSRGEPIAACFTYLTTAKAGYLAFPVSAPDLSPQTAYRAVG